VVEDVRHVDQIGPVRRPQRGQVVQKLADAGEPGRVAVSDQLELSSARGEVRGDAGDGADRPFEAVHRPAVADGLHPAEFHGAVRVHPIVEQQGRAGVPRTLLLAHHQRPGACGGTPVHLAQIVPVAVLAGRRVVRAARTHGLAAGLLGDVPSGRQGSVRELVDDRQDEEVGDGAERTGPLDHPERIGHPHRQRSHPIAASAQRWQVVGQRAGLPAA
jgi:hypothetical protein